MRESRMRRALIFAFVFSACGPGVTIVPELDAGLPDASIEDAGEIDAGEMDA